MNAKFDLGDAPPGEARCGTNGSILDFSNIWIANTSEATVSKINTRTGVEEGRYHVSPSAEGSSVPHLSQSVRATWR